METSPFARLSAELRNRVYHFTPEDTYSDLEITLPLKRHTFKRSIALTQTCRQIRSETRTMFYINRSIDMDLLRKSDVVKLCSLLGTLGSGIVGRLHSVRIHVYNWGLFPVTTSIDFIFAEIEGRPMRGADERSTPLGVLNDWGCRAQSEVFETLVAMGVRVAYITHTRWYHRVMRGVD